MIRLYKQDSEWVAVDSEAPGLSGGGSCHKTALADLKLQLAQMRREHRTENVRAHLHAQFAQHSTAGKRSALQREHGGAK